MGRITIPVYLDLDASWETFGRNEFEQQVHGVRMWKMPQDLARFEQALDRCRPEVVVETGTAWGGSALWFADHGAEVVTVDAENRAEQAREQASRSRVYWVVGNSTDPAVVDRVRDLVAGRRCMVVLDSDHHAPHVEAEIRAYTQLVAPGCYLVVEDGIFDLVGDRGTLGGHGIPSDGGPLAAVQRTVAADPDWERDLAIEQLSPITHDPAGWWRRRG